MQKPALALIVIGLLSSAAHAAFSIEELNQATSLALNDFKTAHQVHVAHFNGYKSWKSGDEAKVKIYVNHAGTTMDFNYLCHKHGAKIECHAQ